MKFTQVPPQTRVVNGKNIPAPDTISYHLDGKGHSKTTRVQYISDDGRTTITHNIYPKHDAFHVELSPRKLKRIKDE